jgi:DNA-binding transcriptional ArsR family regulator
MRDSLGMPSDGGWHRPAGCFAPIMWTKKTMAWETAEKGGRVNTTSAPKLGALAPNLGASANPTSSATVLFGKTRRSVLALLFGHPDEAFHMRQIARFANVGQGAVQRELRRLSRAGIVTRRVEGRQVYYQANAACPIFAELRGIVVKTLGIADVLRAALAGVADHIRFAFLYGSIVRGSFELSSDVDVLVVGGVTFAEVVAALTPTQEVLQREVNPSVYPPEEFRKKLMDGNHFLTTVIDEPRVLLVGGEDELAEVVGERLANRAQDERP